MFLHHTLTSNQLREAQMTSSMMQEFAEDDMPDDAAGTETGPTPAEEGGASLVLRKKDFVERVALAAGVKKGKVREITDAVLQVLGEALANGESLAIPPLGKLRVTKHAGKDGDLLQIKLKRIEAGGKKGEKTDEAPLAEAEE
ncbi:HU family DNA-binding protein [Paenirhodobacter ferrireducens]|uniref:HU family DNA-binding protein n=1 Tax=Paenirhodobacter ferrireducens TaxID=1215032 RepID=UPI0013E30934|nr:HU family DNA-binding protein [Sinirhodobacter ferrireducens]